MFKLNLIDEDGNSASFEFSDLKNIIIGIIDELKLHETDLDTIKIERIGNSFNIERTS